ncbi:MAG: PadR family transcriptional regulator [Chloroflexota bacterium]
MTNSELAILSLINESPRHGYEVDQIIEERGMREWTEVGFSSIYFILTKLERSGLVVGHTEMEVGKGPARKVYNITYAGRLACREAILEALSLPRPWQSPFMIGLANLTTLAPSDTLAALRRYRAGLEERLEHVRSRREGLESPEYHVAAMFDRSATLLEAEIAWVDGFARQVEEHSGDRHDLTP